MSGGGSVIGQRWYLQIVRTTWVLWGYGPRAEGEHSMHVDRASISLGPLGEIPFELPHTHGLPAAQEHARRVGYGWRWNLDGRHTWCFAESVEACIESARLSMLNMRHDTRRIFAEAIKDVRITDEITRVGP